MVLMQRGLNPAEVPLPTALNLVLSLQEMAEGSDDGSSDQWWEDHG